METGEVEGAVMDDDVRGRVPEELVRLERAGPDM